ncbi:MAG: BamA/TamA family outer membrane protein [Prevotellaceae bacterium]|nr:BamA/TamA family outer membrane protein [Prevotellaceae bacterium]
MNPKKTGTLTLIILTALGLSSCSVSRYLDDDEYLLDNVSVRSDDKTLTAGQFTGYIQQHPNSKWFSVLKVPMSPYLLSGTDSTKRYNRFMHRIGQKPVVYDTLKARKAQASIETAVRNLGYLQAKVDMQERRKGFKLRLVYDIHTGQRYYVSSLERSISDPAILLLTDSTRQESLLYEGMPFDANLMEQEITRLNKLLRDNGYYLFNKSLIHFEADTLAGPRDVWLRMTVDGSQQQQYTLGSVSFAEESNSLRERVLQRKNLLEAGQPYSESRVQATYANLATMGAVMSSNIQFSPSPSDTTALDATITVLTNKPHTFNAELEGTNSSGDLGAAVALSYQNRNLLHGSELLNLKVRGAYEAIKGLDGYDAQNYIEYSAEASIAFPDLMIPFIRQSYRRRIVATSEISLMYDSQDRPEFHRRVVTGVWRYRWTAANHRMQHRIDLIDLNYVFMPWISNTFREEYLENASSRNAILRYNYEDLFIMKWGYTLNISSQPITAASTSNYGTNAWNMRLSLETAGNFLQGMTALFRTSKNADGHRTLFNIAYAQYVKGDFDFAKSFRFTPDNSLALHFALGIAYPYGNASVLPYEKRYFSGGANSVRGWSVRELGPGSFRGANGEIDFINQTGDIKLDMNVEYRCHLFWLLDGAAFVDAGNIWTIRDYEEQPGGQFRLDSFYKQIAVSYGLGLRLNFNYFILRLDGGMKAIHPAYTDAKRHYPIIHPDFGRDFSLHFAVGLPF